MASQLLSYLKCNDLLSKNQSAYRANHSTVTATAKIVSDILMAFDHGDIATRALLDCSAAATLWITASYFVNSVSRSVWVIKLCSGSHLIYEEDYSAFHTMTVSRNINLSTTVSHKDRSLDRCSSLSTQLNSDRWSLLIICIHTNTLTMYRHTAGDHQQNQTVYETSCQAAFKISACGYEVIDCS